MHCVDQPPHLVPRLKRRAVPLLSIWAFIAHSRVNYFTLLVHSNTLAAEYTTEQFLYTIFAKQEQNSGTTFSGNATKNWKLTFIWSCMYLASNISFLSFPSFRYVGDTSAGWVCSICHTEKNYETLFSPLLVLTFTTNGSPS
jgi:hypothetical protein